MTPKHVERKLAAILVADVVGYSRLAGADEERVLARLRALRGDLFDPTIAVHRGRVVKGTGDGVLAEFRSVVDAVRCAIEVQDGMAERNAGVTPERRIEFRIGIHLGDVIQEADGDLMGDGINIAARLESIAEPGGLCLSSAAYEQVRGKLPESFVDRGEQSLKNIARPVRVYALARQAPPAEKPGPPRLSIVVLPFANIGGDPEQEYFVDGVTESLTTDLSRITGSFVIARNTAFTFKGKPFDVTRIGRELNVRYVLEGSVQRGGNRMRVNVQLVDAESGAHLWAERFDKPLADLFDLQEEIVARLANALNTQLIAVEARRTQRAPNPNSTDLYFQGMAVLQKGRGREQCLEACGYLDRALALDPLNVEALVSRAWIDVHMGAGFLSDDAPELFKAAEARVTKALSLEPNHARAHYVLAGVQRNTNRIVQSLDECQRALALDRNLASAHGYIGAAKLLMGRGAEVEAHILDALRLSPSDPEAFVWLIWVANGKLQVGADEEAITWLRRSLTIGNIPNAHFALAAAFAHLGRLDEAREAVRTGQALDPTFTVSRFRAVTSARSTNPAYLAGRERVVTGMREAGVPEG